MRLQQKVPPVTTKVQAPPRRNNFYMDDMQAFHEKFDLSDGPELYLDKHASFRQGFLLEEMNELGKAFVDGNLGAYLDALVDLDYVTLGTVNLLGEAAMFQDKNSAFVHLNHLQKDYFKGHSLAAPQPPLPGQYVFFLGNIYTFLGSAFHAVMLAKRGGDMTKNYRDAAIALLEVHRTIVEHAFLCGLNFIEAWDRVHHANMMKQRAEKASDSKRGSTVDVIKPANWKAPDLTDLVGGEDPIPAFFRTEGTDRPVSGG